MIKVIIRRSPNLDYYTAEIVDNYIVYKTGNNFTIQSALSELNEIYRRGKESTLWDYEFVVLHIF